jgi:hypothetical protein
VSDAIDGKAAEEANNGWAIAPQFGQNHMASFQLAVPLENAKDRLLEFSIHQNLADGQHSLGRFRIAVTDAAAPYNFGLPTEIAAALSKPADQRNDAERNAIAGYHRQNDEQYKKLQAEVVAQQQALPPDSRLKELTDELAKAQQPLPLDSKLQQLSRAVALSEEQLKNKRLTVAQDITWALINNPSFLYNH